MSAFKRLIHEVHRRSLWQVLGIYLAGSWVALQVVEQLAGAAGLPQWVQPLSLVLLVIGLPIVLATAFVQEGVSPAAGRGAAAGDGSAVGPVGAPAEPGSAAEGVEDAADARRGRTPFTWRNAIFGGVAAFTLLGLGTAAYLFMRSAGIGPAGTLVAKGVLEDQGRVVLADFESDDPALARAATEAFRVDLSQSRVVRLAEAPLVSEALRRMGRATDDAPLDATTARELARREGIPVVLAGEINRAGGNFLVTADLIESASGTVLVSGREVAADSTQILAAIDGLSRSIRERIGESLRDLASDPPLERVTTTDFGALERYSQAVHLLDVEGNTSRAIELLEEATARDTAFAMAYRKLGVSLNNAEFDRARALRVLELAYRHRDRLTERERLLTVASYHSSVVVDRDRSAAALQSILDRDPDDSWALNNLSIEMHWQGNFDSAAALLSRALVAEDSNSANPWMNLADVRVEQGRWDEASAIIEAATDRLPESFNVFVRSVELAGARWDWAKYEALSREMEDRFRGHPEALGGEDWNLGILAAVRGQIDEARERLLASIEGSEQLGRETWIVGDLIDRAGFFILFGDPARGVREIDSLLQARSVDTLPWANRPDGPLTTYFALAGRADRAREALQRIEEGVSAEGRSREYDLTVGRAEIAIAEGRGDDAVVEVRKPDWEDCQTCQLWIGRAHDAAGQADSTIAAFERFLDMPNMDRLYMDRFWLGYVRERLAQLHDEAGNLERAQEHYAFFVDLWRDADEALQPRVRAAEARLAEIVSIRG